MNRYYPGIRKDFEKRLHQGRTPPEKWVDQSSEVKCPSCGNVFAAEEIKFFGFIKPNQLKILLGASIFVFMSFVLYLVIEAVEKL